MHSVDLIFWLQFSLFSAEHSSREEDYHNEDETFASEQDNGSFGDPATDRVQPRVHFFNYQSFMKKTPTVRWSKQETELFYEVCVARPFLYLLVPLYINYHILEV